MKEKKESSVTNIFIYLLIVIFVLLIIAPPITRIFFADNNSNDSTNSTNSNSTITNVTALTCRREATVGTMIYNITITSNYGNDILNKVTFEYDMPEVVDNTVTDNPVLSEINYIRNTGLVEEDTEGLSTKFILTREMKEANATNTSLDTYFQPLDMQKTNLESLGYTCSMITA